MANPQHLEILKKGVTTWNRWRSNQKFTPDLTEANLRQLNLDRANLTEADIINADISEASLIQADFRMADLTGANLTHSDLTEADLGIANLVGTNLSETELNATEFKWTTLAPLIFIGSAFVACLACYVVGYRAGVKVSPLREERQGQVLYALAMYQAAEATNWTKVQSFLSTQIVAFTRDYERRFGVPSGTDAFARRFPDAKLIADRVEKQMVPVNATSER